MYSLANGRLFEGSYHANSAAALTTQTNLGRKAYSHTRNWTVDAVESDLKPPKSDTLSVGSKFISISIYPLLALTSVPFPNTATADRERQRAQDTKFNYYHYEREVLAPMTPNNVCLPQTSSPSRSSFNFFNRRRESGRKWILKSLKHMEAISISMCYLKFCAHITSGIDHFWQQF